MIRDKLIGLKNYLLSISKFHLALGTAFIIVLVLGIHTVYSNYQLKNNNEIKKEANTTSEDSFDNTLAVTTQPDSSASSTSGTSNSNVSSITGQSNTANSSSSSSSSSGGNSSGSSGGESAPQEEYLSATVAFYADTQTDENPPGEEANHQRVVNYILGTSANPVFHAGDLMEDGTVASLNSFNNVTATLRSTRSFYSAIGNNDRNASYTDVSPLYLDNFSFPNNERWFSVNTGNLHMVVLDSAFSASNASQLAWLESDLQSAASQSRITGVIYHHPSGTLEANIAQKLIDYHVDFVIRGHIHAYGHTVSNGVHYFTCSGQQSIGYILARVYSSYATLSAYNSSNNPIETITVNDR